MAEYRFRLILSGPFSDALSNDELLDMETHPSVLDSSISAGPVSLGAGLVCLTGTDWVGMGAERTTNRAPNASTAKTTTTIATTMQPMSQGVLLPSSS